MRTFEMALVKNAIEIPVVKKMMKGFFLNICWANQV